ncbi:MAG TPA: nitroreductase family protein, partial [Longimicrobium sp.]|nr:nitroreductase family protein [Longimicrobium sp.]
MQSLASTDPWSVSEAAYPADAPEREQLRHLVGYAVLAPSAHNAQPWRFRVTEHWIELHADRSRALSVSDPDGRELAIGCGAALFFLRLAVRRFGHMDRVQLLPDPTRPDLLAVLHRGDEARPGHEVMA